MPALTLLRGRSEQPLTAIDVRRTVAKRFEDQGFAVHDFSRSGYVRVHDVDGLDLTIVARGDEVHGPKVVLRIRDALGEIAQRMKAGPNAYALALPDSPGWRDEIGNVRAFLALAKIAVFWVAQVDGVWSIEDERFEP